MDLAKSVPWLNDEDGSPYTLMNRGGGGMALPNFTNSAPFALADWADNQYIGVELDDVLVDDLRRRLKQDEALRALDPRRPKRMTEPVHSGDGMNGEERETRAGIGGEAIGEEL